MSAIISRLKLKESLENSEGLEKKNSIIESILKNSYLRSLRFRLLVCFMLIGIVPFLIVGGAFASSYSGKILDRKKEEMQHRLTRLEVDLTDEGFPSLVKKDALHTILDVYAMGEGENLSVVDEHYVVTLSTDPTTEGQSLISSVLSAVFVEKIPKSTVTNGFIMVAVPLVDDSGRISGAMILESPFDLLTSLVSETERMGLFLQLFLAVCILLASIILSILLVRPLEKIVRSISKEEDQTFENTIAVSDYTETQKISDAYNHMLSQLKMVDESRQEFVSNVSHELKTPLTSMKVLADSLLASGDEMPVEMYREFMEDITQEIDRENKIINDLLSLVKMDKKNMDLSIETIRIDDLIRQVTKRLEPIADKNEISLITELPEAVDAQIDETKFTLAVNNLIENAIKYNHKGGWVKASLEKDDKFFYLKVEDNGIGIPEADQEKIFERFYRVDKSHSREIGGTGLGLAITRRAVLMHRGAIKVFSKEGEGTTFLVRIPLVYRGVS